MKIRLYIIIFFFIFTSLNSSEKNIPIKLFGIKIYDLVDKYSYYPGTEFFPYENFEKRGLKNYAWMEIESGYYKMIENDNFNKYAVYLSKEDTLNKLASEKLGENINNVKIVGIEALDTNDIFENKTDLFADGSCVNKRNKFLTLYKNKYRIDRDGYTKFMFSKPMDLKFESHKGYVIPDKNIFFMFNCFYRISKDGNVKSNLGVYLLDSDLYDELINIRKLKYELTNSENQVLKNITILKGF